MRPPEEMKARVRIEAGRRRSRRRLLTATAAGAVALVLFGLAVTRSGTDAPSVVSTASDAARPRSGAEVVAGSTPDATTSTSTTTSAPAIDPSTGAPIAPSGTPRSPSGATTTPTGSPANGPDDADGPVDAPTTSAPLPSPTTDLPESTTTTDPSDRICTADDYGPSGLALIVPGALEDQYPANSAPLGRRSQFIFTIGVAEGVVSCWTADSLQVLTVTDAEGREVFRWTYDDGRGRRQITQETWVRFQGIVAWDPACEELAAPEVYQPACWPADLGLYQAHLYEQGVTFPPLTVRVLPGE